MKPILHFKEFRKRVIGAVTQKFFNITKERKGKLIDFEVEEIRDILSTIEEKASNAGKETRTIVKALCPTGWKTLKSFDEDMIIEEYEDYFKSRVKNVGKFGKIAQLIVIVAYS
jgi:hypothetical protein